MIFYQSKTIAYENIDAFEKVAEAISNKLLPGQEDIEIQTKSAILTCRRAKVAALTDHPIGAGNASVNFPDLQGLIGNKTVDVQVCLVFTYSSVPLCLASHSAIHNKAKYLRELMIFEYPIP